MAGHWDRLSSEVVTVPSLPEFKSVWTTLCRARSWTQWSLWVASHSGYSRTHLTRCKTCTFVRSLTSTILQNRRSVLKRDGACCTARFVWIIAHRKRAAGIFTAAARHPAKGFGRQRPQSLGKAQSEEP